MKRSLKMAGCITALIFGATLAEAAWVGNREMPKRLREELREKQKKETARKERMSTPEEKMRREERRARIKARLEKCLLNPIKKLRPRRHPGPPDPNTTARRRERMDSRFEKIVPHRYPAGHRTDTVTNREPSTNVQPARCPLSEIK